MRQKPSSSVRRVFVDTSAYFALLDRHDQCHAEAVGILELLVRSRCRLITTSFVLAETHALILTRLNRAIAAAFLREMDGSPTTVIWVAPGDVEQAREIIERYTDKDFSLTDAVSFAVMNRLKIQHAFTFDDHFAQYGLNIVTLNSF